MMQSNVDDISKTAISDAKRNKGKNISNSDADKNIMNNIPVIGITGGVGSGKSIVMKVLEEDFHGALILADLVGHDLMEPGGESYKKILEHFGEAILEKPDRLPAALGDKIFLENQEPLSDTKNKNAKETLEPLSATEDYTMEEARHIDRKKLASIVFSDESELQVLNEISHGAIREEILRRINAYRRKGDHPFIALEAALLIEGGYEDITDQLWYIYVKPEERIRRLMRDRGYTEEKCRQIMRQQLPDEDFLTHADVVIDNNGSIENIRGQVEKALLDSGIPRPDIEQARLKQPDIEQARLKRSETEQARLKRPETEQDRLKRPETEQDRLKQPDIEQEQDRLKQPEIERNGL